MVKIYLEIALDKDKRDMAAILVANGYSVCYKNRYRMAKAGRRRCLPFGRKGRRKRNEKLSIQYARRVGRR